MINLREKVLLRALNDQITTRRAAVPEVIQSLSDKYPPLAVEGAGERQPVLGLCEILRRQILLVPGRQRARSFGKGSRWEEVVRKLFGGGEVEKEGSHGEG